MLYMPNTCTTGGFGCVFYPELECKNSQDNHENRKHYVSKLQNNRTTNFEYSIIKHLKQIIAPHIPNYQKYLVLDEINTCIPAETQHEIQKKCPKCTIPFSSGESVSQMNIPYMGLPLNTVLSSTKLVPELWHPTKPYTVSRMYSKTLKYFKESSLTSDAIFERLLDPESFTVINLEYTLKTINTRLIDIYQTVIQYINGIGIYHSDIKANNLLIDLPNHPTKYEFHNANIRIIDWGITNTSNLTTVNMNRSLILPVLTPAFMGYYNMYSKTDTIEAIVYTYFSTNPVTPSPHVTLLNEWLVLLSKSNEEYVCGFHPYWYAYIIKWLKYISSRNLSFDYIKEVVLHNSDTIGFISVYVTLYVTIHYNYIIPMQQNDPDRFTQSGTFVDKVYIFYTKLGEICLAMMTNVTSTIPHTKVIKAFTKLGTYLT
jgi:serine/threonine protein kinase